MTFAINEELADKLFRSPFFTDLEEINTTFKIKECKRQVTITRPYQCGISIYQLGKLCMLEFHHDSLDKYLDQHDFELIQMDTDSIYIAILDEFDEIIRPDLQPQYNNGKKAKFLFMSKYHNQMPGLFKANFQGKRSSF